MTRYARRRDNTQAEVEAALRAVKGLPAPWWEKIRSRFR